MGRDENGDSNGEKSNKNRFAAGSLMGRRNLLRLMGTTAAAVSLSPAIGTVAAATTIDLGNKGLSDGDVIDPYFQEYFDNDTEVHVPAGTYEWRGDGLDATANAALIGDGEVVLETDGTELRENITAKSGTVHIKNITDNTYITDGSDGSRIAAWAEDGATLLLENFNRPRGQQEGSDNTGFYVPPEHAGTVVFRNCTVNRCNNGIYGSTPEKQAGGRVVVEGGLFKNNNIAAVRLGSTDSVVRYVTVHNDAPIPEDTTGDPPGLGRGIWVRQGGDNLSIYNCDITFESDSDGSANPIIINPDADDITGGSGDITDCRIHHDRSGDAVEISDTAGDWGGSGNHITGTSTRVDSDYQGTIACTGGGCDLPTTEKQWVDANGDPIDGSDGSTSTTTTTTASFEQGVNGYGGTVDTYLQEDSPGADNSSASDLNVDTDDPQGSGQHVQALLRFEDVFGSNDGQVPPGASISTATLTLQTTNPGDGGDLHRMLTSWSDTDSWDTFGNEGVQPDGSAAAVDAAASVSSVSKGDTTIDVTTSVQSWADGAANRGWAFLPVGGDGWDFNSAEGSTPPTLTVEYEEGTGGDGGNPPSVDSLSAAEVETSDSDAEFDVSWDVSDADGELSSVDLVLTQDSDSTTEDTVSISVSSDTASGTTRLVATGDEGSGNSYTVDITVTDGGSNSTSDSTSVSETESTNSAPVIDSYTVTEAGSPNPHAEMTAGWSVSDGDGNLDTVVVEVFDSSGTVVDSATTNVSGSSTSGSDSLKIKHADGQTFDVTLTVTDTDGVSESATQTVTE